MSAGDDEQLDAEAVARQMIERFGGSTERPEPDVQERARAALEGLDVGSFWSGQSPDEYLKRASQASAGELKRTLPGVAEMLGGTNLGSGFPMAPARAEVLLDDPNARIARAIVDEQERRALHRAELADPTGHAAIVALGNAIAAALLDHWKAPDMEQLVDMLADRLGVDRLMGFMQALADRVGEPPEPRGNALALVRQRAQALGACVAIMGRYPNETRFTASGRFAASRIAGLAVSHHKQLWGKDGPGQDADCAPLEEEGIARLVSRYLQHLTQT